MNETKDKRCPLRVIATVSGYCIKEECAWYQERYKTCAVLDIAQAIETIAEAQS